MSFTLSSLYNYHLHLNKVEEDLCSREEGRLLDAKEESLQKDNNALKASIDGFKESAVLTGDKAEFAKLVSAIKASYTNKYAESNRHWGDGLRGRKSIAKLEARAKALGKDKSTVSHTV
ncbi:hypothetical protein JCM3774_003858 [Rhodotorula dairenensis]